MNIYTKCDCMWWNLSNSCKEISLKTPELHGSANIKGLWIIHKTHYLHPSSALLTVVSEVCWLWFWTNTVGGAKVEGNEGNISILPPNHCQFLQSRTPGGLWIIILPITLGTLRSLISVKALSVLSRKWCIVLPLKSGKQSPCPSSTTGWKLFRHFYWGTEQALTCLLKLYLLFLQRLNGLIVSCCGQIPNECNFM